MKKIIAVGLVLVSMMGVLASCGSFECDLCGEEKKAALSVAIGKSE